MATLAPPQAAYAPYDPRQSIFARELAAPFVKDSTKSAYVAEEANNAADRVHDLQQGGRWVSDGKGGLAWQKTGPSAAQLIGANAGPIGSQYPGLVSAAASDLASGKNDAGGDQANDLAAVFGQSTATPLLTPGAPQTNLDDLQRNADYLRNVAGGAPTAATAQFRQGIVHAQAGQHSLASGIAGAQGSAALQNANEASADIAARGAQGLAAQQAAERLNAQGQLIDANAALGAAGKTQSDAMAAALNPDQLLAARQAQADAERQRIQNLLTRQGLNAGLGTAFTGAANNDLSNKVFNDNNSSRLAQLLANLQIKQLGTAAGINVGVTPAVTGVGIANADRNVNTLGADVGAAGALAGGLIAKSKNSGTTAPTGIDTTNPYE